MAFRSVLFLLLQLVSGISLWASPTPKAVNGVIDLRNADLGAGVFELSGDWVFRWQELHVTNPSSLAGQSQGFFVRAPRAWNDYAPGGHKLGGHGYATYSLRILLPENSPLLAITMKEQGTAIRAFANGKEVGSMGVVATDPAGATPNTRPFTIILTEKTTSLNLDLQISNFHYRKGGMWSNVSIGRADIIRGKVRQGLAMDAFVAGCLLIIAAYHAGLYLFYRQGSAPLLFAAFCLVMSIRLVSTGYRILPDLFPEIPFAVYSRLEFFSWFFIIPIGVHYANAMFQIQRNRWFLPVNYAVAGLLSLALLCPPTFYSYLVIPSQVYMLLLAGYALQRLIVLARQSAPGVQLFLFGSIVLMAATVNDVLYSNEILRITQLGPYGMLVFIFCQAMVISRRLFIVFKQKDEAQTALNKLLLGRIERSKSELLSEKVAAQATKQQFLNVVNNIPGITYRCDPEYPWKMYFLSDEIFRLTGYPAGDFTRPDGINIASIIHPDDLQFVNASDRSETEKRYRLTYRLICADGRIIWVEDSGQAVFDDMQNLVWLDGVMLDITARKNIELEILAAREKAEAANIAKSNFLATMSHELRTPLHGVIGMTSVLKQTLLTQEQAGYAAVIENSGHALLALINDILDLSKIESGKIEIDKVAFDLRHHVRDVMDMIVVQARQKNIAVTQTISPDLPNNILGDPARLRQILLNLLGNAVKFTRVGGISLEVIPSLDSHGKKAVSFIVRDTGIGIPAQSLDVIFQPFRQADQSTTREFGGTGLGLAISKQLSEMLGGSISVESTPGLGSVFTVNIPLVEADAVTNEATEPDGKEFSTPAEFEFMGQTILLAEDDPVNQLVSSTLLGQMGLNVHIAPNGEELLQLMTMTNPDLILMDCMMPLMDGYEATRRIREREARENLPRIPIIALTANASQKDREKSMAAGMDEFVSKPFTATDIARVLRQWLKAISRPARSL